ncbi:MAG: hypothetical protein N2423_07625, partial [Novosphingobium sp.]|nr:hypothetical protein [Novosphingobium sp.]
VRVLRHRVNGGAVAAFQRAFWLGEAEGISAPARHAHVLHHPGAGNSIGFADPHSRFAFAFTHNRMQAPRSNAENTALILADAVRAELGLE